MPQLLKKPHRLAFKRFAAADRLKEAIFRVSEAVYSAPDLNELFHQMHQIVGELIPARNFYIALYEPDAQTLHFPYFIDEYDPPPPDMKMGQTLTGYVIRHQKPLLVDPGEFQKLVESGEVESVGTPSIDWLGVPLKTSAGKTIGAMVVQTYTPGVRYSSADLDILNFVSNQVALAIERKRSEEALAMEKERLTVTLRSIGDGVIASDVEGRILLINRVAEELTGWSQDEALGRPLSEVFHIIHEQTGEPLDDPVQKTLESGRTIEFAERPLLLERDGVRRVIADSSAPIRDRENRIIGIVLVFRDITEKLKTDEELIKMQKLESIGILAGGIAHDFNNILTAILGNISLAKSQLSPEARHFQFLSNAEKAALQAQSLTQQLLTFAAGSAPIKEVVAVEEMVRDAVSFALRGSDIVCRYEFSPDLPTLEMDRGQMNQVVQNLVINAKEAMPDGGTIDVRARNITLTDRENLPLKEGPYVRISVYDQGQGIPRELLKRIFEPYFTTKLQGSGLGLAIAFSIVKKHDGFIAVESAQGMGSVFHIYLPASEKAVTVSRPSQAQLLKGQGRILVMDDESLVRQVAAEMLQQLGYEVTCVVEGGQAIEEWSKAKEAGRPYQVLILDLTVPGGMGGREAIKKILQLDPRTRVLVSSGYSNDPVMAHYRDYGFSGVIVKPYTFSALAEAVHKLIQAED